MRLLVLPLHPIFPKILQELRKCATLYPTTGRRARDPDRARVLTIPKSVFISRANAGNCARPIRQQPTARHARKNAAKSARIARQTGKRRVIARLEYAQTKPDFNRPDTSPFCTETAQKRRPLTTLSHRTSVGNKAKTSDLTRHRPTSVDPSHRTERISVQKGKSPETVLRCHHGAGTIGGSSRDRAHFRHSGAPDNPSAKKISLRHLGTFGDIWGHLGTYVPLSRQNERDSVP